MLKLTAYMSKLFSFIATKKGVLFVVGIAVVIGGVAAFSGGGEQKIDTGFAERRTVREEVSVTGRVEAATDVDLSFERSGQVARIDKKVGESVEEGEVIMVLENSSQSARLAQAQADLDIERIKLQELLGNGGSAVTDSQNDITLAELSLADARENLIGEIREAFADADDAIRNNVDGLFNNPDTNPSYGALVSSGGSTYSIGSSNLSQKIEVNSGRRQVNKIFNTWDNLVLGGDIAGIADDVITDLEFIQDFLGGVAVLVNDLNNPADTTAQTLYDGYRAGVSTARTTINAALSALRIDLQTYKTERTDLTFVQAQTSSTGEDTRLQQARVRSAEARVAELQATLNEGIVISPTEGVVTSLKTRIGEVVQANTPVVTVVSDALYEIVVNIPEADISRVAIGNRAELTLDAYSSSELFAATVTSIDLSETIIGGVATYEAMLQFNELDPRIRSGMTANVDIFGREAVDVVAVPQRALITRNGQRVVRVIQNGDIVEIPVVAGLRGADGFVEIMSGIEEGQEIVIFIEE